ncbi:hypothetical protein BF95_26105 [Sphingobium sp. Ant17]|nr:hypothetical protein BF95_26105 [Sphingobium sp. Ant17]
MFARFALLATLLAGILCYGLLPLAADFATFAMMMGLFMLPLGVWAAVNPMATLILAFGLSNINLQGHYSPPDFGTFVEASVASMLGIFTAILGAGLFRTWGVQHQLQRVLRIEAREIARLSRSPSRRLRDSYVQRALDRISVVTARLAAAGQVERSAGLLIRLRVGANVATCARWATRFPPMGGRRRIGFSINSAASSTSRSRRPVCSRSSTKHLMRSGREMVRPALAPTAPFMP